MKEKIKKVFKSKIFFFILGVFVCGTAGVYAATYFPSVDVTYDNTGSGLESMDVQGAIDELYNTCSKVVSTGDYIFVSWLNTYSNSFGISKISIKTGEETVIKENLVQLVGFAIN